MASEYPAGLDDFETHHDGQQEIIHAAHVNSIGEAVAAVQTVLGLNPQAAEITVAARLAAIEARLDELDPGGGGGGGGDDLVIDGGTPSTTAFDSVIDGGTPGTTVFATVIDGGAP